MRVSTSQIYNLANIGMTKSQAAVNRTTEQMVSGKRLLTPADDPIAATTILQLNQQLARIDQYKKNIDIAEHNLKLEETALDAITNLVQRMRELTVSAGNTAVNTAANYQALAAEVDSRIEELLNLQNTRNASGQYIFAGYQANSAPFVSDGGGNYSYRGDEGQLRIQISETVSVPVNDNGKRIFMDIPSGHATFNAVAGQGNRAAPPALITAGYVVDPEVYGRMHPEDLIVTFNGHNSISPSGANYTITERSTGNILVANEPYLPGQEIDVAGIRFTIAGTPHPGVSAQPASLPLAFGGAVDFSAAPATLTLTVGGITETLVLDQPVNSTADLLAALGSSVETVPGSGAQRNAAKLANLGLTLDPVEGLVSASGHNITLRNGSADTDTVTGLTTQGQGTTTTNGAQAQPGDRFEINATKNQGLLTTLSRLSEAMRSVKDTPESMDALAEVVARTLTNLDNAVTQLAAVKGELGARMNTLDSSLELNLDTKLYTETILSDLESLDYADATVRLSMESFILSAAQQSFVKVSQLTLFNYL